MNKRSGRARTFLPFVKSRSAHKSVYAARVKKPLGLTPFVLATVAAALCIPLLVMLAVRTDPDVAEWWVRNIQAGWERFAGSITDIFPFSVLELLIVAAILLGVFLLVRLFIDLCSARFYSILIGALSLLVGAAYVLDMYIMSMGFGYYRKAMPLPQSEAEYGAAEVLAAAQYFADDYNALAASLPRDKNGCVVCPYTFKQLSDRIEREYKRITDPYFNAYTPDAKPVVNSWFLSDMLITGVTFLPVGEATLNTAAPPTTLTLTMAHELAHAKGVQREGDANLLARYILVSSDDGYLRYCGYYGAFDNLLLALRLNGDNDGYNRLGASISPLVIKEKEYSFDYWNSQPDLIGQIAEFFNDLYLKANGATNGTGSYNDGNKSDVVIPIDPDTGEPEKDPDTGETVVRIEYSQIQRMFFYLYENR